MSVSWDLDESSLFDHLHKLNWKKKNISKFKRFSAPCLVALEEDVEIC